jgi:cell division protein FtsI/penicillin-binding protein 2
LQTPLQLAALMGAIANGGTLYSLQYPRSAKELARFRPQVRRKLSIETAIPGILPGLLGAVERGTARHARQAEPIAGKTGTCSENHAHLGWFGAFNNAGRKLVVVVLLRGGRQATGPRAAAIAGEVFRELGLQSYLVDSPLPHPATPPAAYAGLNGSAVAWGLVLLGSSAILILIRRNLRAS